MKKAICLLLICLPGIALPQAVKNLSASYKIQQPKQSDYWGDVDGFYNRQHEVTLDLVNELIKRFPPAIPEPIERHSALLLLDGVFHDKKAPDRKSVQNFLIGRITDVADEIAKTQPEEGAVIWKLYNDGFVVKTNSASVAFDIVSGKSAGAEGFEIPENVIDKIVDNCDVLFISHKHSDHADISVAQKFIDQGKPVVAPDGVWNDSPVFNKIIHLAPIPEKVHQLKIKNGREQLKVKIYPGHQGYDVQNNVALVTTSGGITFCQTGDQANDDDFKWIDKICEYNKVDILLPNCWTTDIKRMAKGINPKIIITGHENEMGHTIDHREPYWLTYERLYRSPFPKLLMTWGEKYFYRGRKK